MTDESSERIPPAMFAVESSLSVTGPERKPVATFVMESSLSITGAVRQIAARASDAAIDQLVDAQRLPADKAARLRELLGLIISEASTTVDSEPRTLDRITNAARDAGIDVAESTTDREVHLADTITGDAELSVTVTTTASGVVNDGRRDNLKALADEAAEVLRWISPPLAMSAAFDPSRTTDKINAVIGFLLFIISYFTRDGSKDQ